MTGVMIAYLPSSAPWARQDLPHMTLVYAGDILNSPRLDINALAKDALTAARMTRGGLMLDVIGVEQFGEDSEAVDVLELYPTPALLMARRLVEPWNDSSYKNYRPHVTIGPVGSINTLETIPTQIYFDSIGVFNGSEKMVFMLDRY